MYLFRESRLVVLILVAASLLIIVNGCRRPTGQPSNRSHVGDSSEQGGGKDRQQADSNGAPGRSTREAPSSAESSHRDGRDSSRRPIGNDSSDVESDGSLGDRGPGQPSGKTGAKSAPATSGEGVGHGSFGGESGRSSAARNSAVQKARDVLTQSNESDARRRYQSLLEAWQSLGPFTENDPEAAALANRLLQQMEKVGSTFDQRESPDVDKALIAQ